MNKTGIKAKNKSEYHKLYQRWRYQNDPVYRQKMIDANQKNIRRKELNDPVFKKKRDGWNRKANRTLRQKQKRNTNSKT